MALSLQSIALLLGEHQHQPFAGPVLTLGRQYVPFSYGAMLELFRQRGVVPQPLPATLSFDQSNGKRVWGDRVLFAHLGLESTALDVSDYEEAEIVHDLNQPIPDALRGRYGTVFDGGTFEHVFCVSNAFTNVAELVRPGGRVLHLSPVNNYVNHGYWQLSPRSFFDFYEVNGFTDLRSTLIVHPRNDDGTRTWATFSFDPREPGGASNFYSSKGDFLTVLFSAVKQEGSTSDRIPNQVFANADHYELELRPEGLEATRVRRA
jgi:hypothetical protein